jgi:hypothetical protein
MQDNITEQYQDVLQNIEFAIIRAYERDRSLLDLDVLDLLDAAVRRYGSEAQGRVPPAPRLAGKIVPAYELVERMCEWRLGRTTMGGEAGTPEVSAPNVITIDELVACLKRVRKSVKFWNDEAGRQGYLEYISQFIGTG